MNVCIVTTSFPRWPGDSRGTFVFEAARALAACGDTTVRVIAMHSPGARTRETLDGIDVIRPRYLLPERWEILQAAGGGLPVMWRQNRWTRLVVLPFLVAQTLAVWRHARGCDVIHANWTLSAAVAYFAHWWHHLPLVVTVQGSDIFQAARLPFIGAVTRAILARSQRVLALSGALAQATLALGVPAASVTIVPNGVDTRVFYPAPGPREPLIVFVGSLIERKGVRYLIEALPAVLAAQPEARLVVVGEGPQHEALARLADSLGLGAQVAFAGALPPAQTAAWLRQARVMVLPSVEEGLGVVLLEALASGTPCVASNVGGIPDVVTPEVGRLVPPADPAALATAIGAVLADTDGWEAMSQAARRLAVEQFDWGRIAARLLAIYAEGSATWRNSN